MKHKNLFLKFILALHSARALARHGGEYYEKKNFSYNYDTYIRRSNAYSMWFIRR